MTGETSLHIHVLFVSMRKCSLISNISFYRYALALWLEKKSLNVNRTSGSLQKDLYKQFLMKDDHAKEIDTSKASNL